MNFILYHIEYNLLFVETLVLFTHVECSTASLIVVQYIILLLQDISYGITAFVSFKGVFEMSVVWSVKPHTFCIVLLCNLHTRLPSKIFTLL
jgi:hypothetical protein